MRELVSRKGTCSQINAVMLGDAAKGDDRASAFEVILFLAVQVRRR